MWFLIKKSYISFQSGFLRITLISALLFRGASTRDGRLIETGRVIGRLR